MPCRSLSGGTRGLLWFQSADIWPVLWLWYVLLHVSWIFVTQCVCRLWQWLVHLYIHLEAKLLQSTPNAIEVKSIKLDNSCYNQFRPNRTGVDMFLMSKEDVLIEASYLYVPHKWGKQHNRIRKLPTVIQFRIRVLIRVFSMYDVNENIVGLL